MSAPAPQLPESLFARLTRLKGRSPGHPALQHLGENVDLLLTAMTDEGICALDPLNLNSELIATWRAELCGARSVTQERTLALVEDEPTALEQAAQNRRYGLGRVWDADVCIGNIQRATGVMLEAAVEIGRNLLWAKQSLPHGRFEAWVEAHCPFKDRTAHKYMAVAETFLDRPRLLAELRGVGVKKAALLTQLDPEVLTLIEEGGAPNLTPTEVASTSYGTLKQKLAEVQASLKTATQQAEDNRRWAQEQAEAARAATDKNRLLTEQLAARNGISLSTEAEAKAAIGKLWTEFNEAIGGIAWEMDRLMGAAGQLSPETQAHLAGLGEGMRQRMEVEALRWRELRGDEVLGFEWSQVKAGEVGAYPTPASRYAASAEG
ncbi:DUF3102 domain-containing protein [Myxococcota bacterium]|nr:DUF3102 domain-containing protein [Myxococcota bacterium]